MVKLFDGNVPEGAMLVAESRGWALYRFDPVGDWASVKLVSRVRRPRANWHLSWSLSERRLAGSVDAKRLDVEAPEVFDWVVEALVAAS